MGYRVASLLPAATEIVCALGAEADLVGISHECDFPETVRRLPALTRARVRPVGASRDIDREVRLVLQDALAVYEIELARLEAARPDVIVTQDLCDVCAVSFSDVCAATAALVHQAIRIVNLHPTRFDDIWAESPGSPTRSVERRRAPRS
jgi:iron complex transport system substrate-binding protein